VSRTDDLQLLELLAAKLCHDLVGPVGAVANGVELLRADGAGDPEVVGLIENSARSASRRLQLFRIAFGTANALPATGRVAEIRRLSQGYLEGGRIELDWPDPDAASEAAAGRSGVKLGLMLILVAAEALPRGGTLKVKVGAPAGRFQVTVTAAGVQARLPEEVQSALEARGGDLAPKAMPAFLAASLAASAGAKLTTSAANPGAVDLTIDCPAQV
jgi:histidine phosphotransferase ChpT